MDIWYLPHGLVLSQEMGLGPPPEPKPWWEKKDAGRPRQFFSKMRQICKKYLLRMRGTQNDWEISWISIYLYIFLYFYKYLIPKLIVDRHDMMEQCFSRNCSSWQVGYTPKTNMVVCTCFLFSNGPFSGSILAFWGVYSLMILTCPIHWSIKAWKQSWHSRTNIHTLPETNIAPENWPSRKETGIGSKCGFLENPSRNSPFPSHPSNSKPATEK